MEPDQKKEVSQINSKHVETNITEKKHIAVCIPCYGTISALWFAKFMGFLNKLSQKYIVTLKIHEQQPVSISRETLVEISLPHNTDYIFFLDSDNLVDVGHVDRLIQTMEEYKADLVTGIYFSKDKPYYPIIKSYRSGGFWRIENPKIGTKFDIGGCGMGCCLIRSNVFEKIQRPWFKFSHETWGKRNVVISEDLYFCRKMNELNMKMMCDTTVISGHIGATADLEEFLAFGGLRQNVAQDRDEIMKDVKDFLELTQEQVDMNTIDGVTLMREEWLKEDPKTPEEEKKFYKETENYIYDLTHWHFGNRRDFDMNLLNTVKTYMQAENKQNPKVLDFGSGIGQNALMLARAGCDVTLADLDSKTMDFARYRFMQHQVSFKVWNTDLEERPPEEKYDIILAFDVFEHLDLETLRKYLKVLNTLKHKDTKIVYSATFNKNAGGENSHPMHHEHKPEHDKLINEFAAHIE